MLDLGYYLNVVSIDFIHSLWGPHKKNVADTCSCECAYKCGLLYT